MSVDPERNSIQGYYCKPVVTSTERTKTVGHRFTPLCTGRSSRQQKFLPKLGQILASEIIS